MLYHLLILKIIARIVGIPAFIAIPIITPEKATMEPTDKSIPPVIITNVIGQKIELAYQLQNQEGQPFASYQLEITWG